MMVGILVLVLAGSIGCQSNQLPYPNVRVERVSWEHGRWREIPEEKGGVGELHFHAEEFSLTFKPFEYYKDYWGRYALLERAID